MLFETLAIAFLAALLTGGRPRNLEQVQFRHIWLMITAFLLQFGLDAAAMQGQAWVNQYRIYVHLFSYLLLFVAIYLNWSVPGMKLIGFGVFMNFLVIAANQGVMPVSGDFLPPEMQSALAAGNSGTHGLLGPDTRLRYLADLIYVPLPYQKNLLSFGDIALDLGAFLLIFFGMKTSRPGDYYKFTYVNRKL